MYTTCNCDPEWTLQEAHQDDISVDHTAPKGGGSTTLVHEYENE